MQSFWKRSSWQFVKQAYQSNGFWSALLVFFNKCPELFYPPNEAAYTALVAEYGEETWWAPQNWWRQLFHLLGGFLIGLPFGLFNCNLLDYIVIGSIFLTFGYIDFIIDIPEGKEWQKAILDLCFWTSAVALGCYVFRL